MSYTGAQPDNGNHSRADERQARADALKAIYQQPVHPSKAAIADLAEYILTGEWPK